MVSILPKDTSSANLPELKYRITGQDGSGIMRLDFGSILATGKHSDFRIQCGTHVFHVHRAVLCSASAFFKAAMEGNTKVRLLDLRAQEQKMFTTDSLIQESDKNKIAMPDDEPAILARLLIFVYTGVYFKRPLSEWTYDRTTPFTALQDPYETATSRWHVASKLAVAMYQISDKLFIDSLKRTSRNTFLIDLRPTPKDSDEDNDHHFWKLNEMKKVCEIVKMVYSTTRADDWMLHDPIVHKLLVGMQTYGCVKWEYHQPLMEDVPRLAFEIATSQLGSRRNAPKCGKCGKKSPQRLWRCKCGQMEDCQDVECIEMRRVRSICDHCVCFGTCRV